MLSRGLACVEYANGARHTPVSYTHLDVYKRQVKFFEEQKNRDTLNRMRQLLGQQRKEEEYLDGERVYKPRVGKE